MLAHARLLLALAAVLVLAPATFAQRGARFDPQEDLEGYQEAYLGDHSDLYDFEPFDAASGRRLSAAQLEALVERWAAERARVAARIEAIETDPKERFLYETDRRLRRSRFFRSLEVRRVDTYDPFFFYVEMPSKPQSGYAERVAGQLGPWVQELERIFREDYVEPQELEPQADRAGYAIVVLATEGSYKDYAQAVRSLGIYRSQAHYDPELRMAITYRDAFGALQAPHLSRRPILHEVVHALQHAYAADDMPGETWFNEGLAEYLSYHLGHEPPALRDHPIDREAVRAAVPFTQLVAREVLLSLPDLSAQQGYNAAIGVLRTRAREAGFDVPSDFAMSLIYVQSCLWMHYLHHGEDGKYRAALGRYVKAALAGRGGERGLREAFADVDPGELRQGFLAYVRAAFEEMNPGVELPEIMEAGAPAEAAAGAPRPAFDPAALAPPEGDAELGLALALHRARTGAFTAAAGELRALADSGPPAELQERVSRELERLEGMVALRLRFFEHLVRTKKKLKLRRGDAWLIAAVEAVEGDVARLGSNRLKVPELALEELDGLALVELMRDSKFKFDDHWLMAYPHALTGDLAAGQRFLDGSSGARALAADAQDDLPGRARVGELAVELRALAEDGLPEGDPEAARAAFEVARRLLVEERELALVADRREALLGLARAALEGEFGGRSLTDALNGEVEELGGGRLRITYDFDDPREAQDFEAIAHDYALDFVSEEMLPATEGALSVVRGNLRATGTACSRHVLPLENVSLRYSVVLQEPWTTRSGFFQVGLGDDGYGNYIACVQLGSLFVLDKPSGTVRQLAGDAPGMILGQTYHVALENDGQELVSKIDGREVGRVLVEPRTRGSVFLSVASESPVEFRELAIEGTASEEVLATLRERWIERRLDEAGIAR